MNPDYAYQKSSGIMGASTDAMRNVAPRGPQAESVMQAACRTIDEDIVATARSAEARLSEMLGRLRGPVPQEAMKDASIGGGGVADRMARSLQEGRSHLSQIHNLLGELEKFV